MAQRWYRNPFISGKPLQAGTPDAIIISALATGFTSVLMMMLWIAIAYGMLVDARMFALLVPGIIIMSYWCRRISLRTTLITALISGVSLASIILFFMSGRMNAAFASVLLIGPQAVLMSIAPLYHFLRPVPNPHQNNSGDHAPAQRTLGQIVERDDILPRAK